MVEAVDVRTSGLGRRQRGGLRPAAATARSGRARRCRSVCWRIAFRRRSRSCAALAELAAPSRVRDAIRLSQSRIASAPEHLSALERRVWERARSRAAPGVGRGAQRPRVSRPCAGWPMRGSRRSRRSRRAMRCTCSSGSAAGAARLRSAERAFSPSRSAMRAPPRAAVAPRELCERTYEHVVAASAARAARGSAGARPGSRGASGSWGVLGERLHGCRRRRTARCRSWMRATLGLARPLVAIGAPVERLLPGGGASARGRAVHSGARRGLQRRRRGRRRRLAEASRSWSINRRSRCSACTIRPAARIIRTRAGARACASASRATLALGGARGAPARPIRTSIPA